MNNKEQFTDSELLTIHYDGEKISNHQMSLDNFIISLNGFNDLVKNIAYEIGFSNDAVSFNITPLENGGIKANIIIAVTTFLGTTFGNYIFEHAMEDLNIYERMGAKAIVYHLNNFLERKKNAKNYKDIFSLTKGLDIVGTKIMKNKNVHISAENFTSVLNYNVDKIEIYSDTNDSKKNVIDKSKIELFKNPFNEQDIEEKIYDEEKILRLDGPRSLDSEWLFYEKNSKNKWDKNSVFRAIVLDDFLLSLGREKSLKYLENQDLFCIVRYKEVMKNGNKKKVIEKYIIKCSLKEETFI